MIQLLHYWAGLDRGGRQLPPIRALNPQAIPTLWHHCYLIWLGDQRGAVFDQVGGMFAQDCGDDLTGRPVAATPAGTLLAGCIGWIDTVLEHLEPVTFGGTLEHAHGSSLQFRGIILPFLDGDGAASYLLGAANLRTLPATTATAPPGTVFGGHVFRQKSQEFGEVSAPAA